MILYTNILFILCNRNNLKPHTSVWRTLKKSRNPVQIESALTSRFSILTEFEWSPRSDEFSYDYESLHFDHKTPCKCHVIILFQIKQFSTHQICVWNKILLILNRSLHAIKHSWTFVPWKIYNTSRRKVVCNPDIVLTCYTWIHCLHF